MDNLHGDTIRVTDVTERFFNFCKFSSLLPMAKVLLSHFKISRGQRSLTAASMALGAAAVLLLALTREAYAICVSFLLMIIKGTLLLKYERK